MKRPKPHKSGKNTKKGFLLRADEETIERWRERALARRMTLTAWILLHLPCSTPYEKENARLLKARGW